jgi:hypothetical protein
VGSSLNVFLLYQRKHERQSKPEDESLRLEAEHALGQIIINFKLDLG